MKGLMIGLFFSLHFTSLFFHPSFPHSSTFVSSSSALISHPVSSAFAQEWKNSSFTSLTRPGTSLSPRSPHPLVLLIPSSPHLWVCNLSDQDYGHTWRNYTGTDKTKSNSKNQEFKFRFQIKCLDTNWSSSSLHHHCCHHLLHHQLFFISWTPSSCHPLHQFIPSSSHLHYLYFLISSLSSLPVFIIFIMRIWRCSSCIVHQMSVLMRDLHFERMLISTQSPVWDYELGAVDPSDHI